MNTLAIVKSTLLAVTFCAASCAHAGSVEILGQNSGSAEIQKSVIGVWSTNQRISFSESGRYTMVLSDFGSTNQKFGDSFSYLGAMISSSVDNIASINVGNDMNTGNTLLSFDIAEGEYWLSLFAITDSSHNTGTFNLSVMSGESSPVPLPASFWLMATSLLGLISFARQNRAAKTKSKNFTFA